MVLHDSDSGLGVNGTSSAMVRRSDRSWKPSVSLTDFAPVRVRLVIPGEDTSAGRPEKVSTPTNRQGE